MSWKYDDTWRRSSPLDKRLTTRTLHHSRQPALSAPEGDSADHHCGDRLELEARSQVRLAGGRPAVSSIAPIPVIRPQMM
jgi:hypothetical protein